MPPRPFAFDPVEVGRSECEAWAAYYRREWLRFTRGALGMVLHGFGLGPVRDLRAAWHVMQANRAWAPQTGNDPDAARREMARFYRLVDAAGRLRVDPERAAALEVAWWHAHRERQHGPEGDPDRRRGRDTLVQALVDLYGYLYRAEPAAVRPAAELRVQAMDASDAWVRAGSRRDDPLLADERLALVASFTALRDAWDRGRIRPT